MFGAESGVMMAFMGIFYAGAGAGQAAIMVGDASKAKVEMFLWWWAGGRGGILFEFGSFLVHLVVKRVSTNNDFLIMVN